MDYYWNIWAEATQSYPFSLVTFQKRLPGRVVDKIFSSIQPLSRDTKSPADTYYIAIFNAKRSEELHSQGTAPKTRYVMNIPIPVVIHLKRKSYESNSTLRT